MSEVAIKSARLSATSPIVLLYDKQCPACNYYCNLVAIRQSLRDSGVALELIDARQDSNAMRAVTDRGWDIDQGMVLIVDQQMYYGGDAIHALALLGSRRGLFNRFNYWIFRSPARARLLYPPLKFIRNLLLKAKGVSKINNLDLDNNERF